MLGRALAIIAAAAILAGLSASPALAAADAPPTGTSTAVQAQKGKIVASSSILLLGGVLGPAVDGLVGGLLTGVANAPADITSALTEALFGSFTAHAPAAGVLTGSGYMDGPIDPAKNIPQGCSTASGTCYSTLALGADSSGSPLLGLKLGVIQGIVENVDQGNQTQVLTSHAQVAGVELSLLGLVQVVKTGVIGSTSQCASTFETEGTPSTSTTSVASIGVLGLAGGQPLLQVTIAADGSVLDVLLGGKSIVGLGPQELSLNLLGGALGATVWLDGHLLRATVHLGTASLLNGLGLGALSGLVDLLAKADVSLDLAIGSLVTDGGPSTSGSGLAIQAGLSAQISVLAGLLSITIGSGPGADSLGNLLDLRLASTNCSSTGSIPSTNHWILPGLT
jgi:hypothetical protein